MKAYEIAMRIEGTKFPMTHVSSPQLAEDWNAIVQRAHEAYIRHKWNRYAPIKDTTSQRFNNLTHLYKHNPLPGGLFWSAHNKCFVYKPNKTVMWVMYNESLREVMKRYNQSAHYINGWKIPPSIRTPEIHRFIALAKEEGAIS